ncbi:polysaccharide deacetylase family protein [Heliobacterium gestii]|uniref:Polysaccharide deacetylase family protein n=1 Tax=Heliomicrobium gestii TaxID=2699 RepID=A0A845LNV3_HELGE|nr:polysaccharide deacetylase family protein [Heliomicrobium gestii]MBM7868390.1 peptidoglycan/xylan/chitin deacetylase (PgdA/CDA1 family) [Heliomicrobium gestii]MZP44556.1 polysaccharide deacetylase family protein [Heliomicrobium gestii]
MRALFIPWTFLRVLLTLTVVCLLLAGMTQFVITLNQDIAETSGRSEADSVVRRGPPVNKVALTINVDWGQEHIQALLDSLSRHQAKATFFFTGRFADNFPEYVTKVHEAGHEVGNHGYSHPHPTQISEGANREEIRRTHGALVKLTGLAPKWFAPPYGELDERVLSTARQEGYRTILWTVDSADWLKPSPQEWMKRVTAGIGPGALVLMHPTAPTVQALPSLLNYIKEKGWQAVTLTELLGTAERP